MSQYKHFVLPILSVESVRQGVINIEGLNDDDLDRVLEDVDSLHSWSLTVIAERKRRERVQNDWRIASHDRKVVPIRPFEPRDYQ